MKNIVELISGPIVVFRLEGSLGHVVWLFGDVHYDVLAQNECHITQDSTRIDHFLRRRMKTAVAKNLKVTFHLETTPNQTWSQSHLTPTQGYLYSLRHLFAELEKQSTPNLSLNAFDIRIGNPEFIELISKRHVGINNVLQEWILLKLIYQKALKSILHHNPPPNSTIKDFVKTVCNKLPFSKTLQRIQKLVTAFHEMKYTRSASKLQRVINRIIDTYWIMKERVVETFSVLNDLYLLPHILPPEKNKIDYVYSGAYHTMNLAMYMMKHYGYKITHSTANAAFISKNAENYTPAWFLKNAEQVMNNAIGKSLDEGLIQCVDLGAFPEL